MPLRPFRTPKRGGQLSAEEVRRLAQTVQVHDQVVSHPGIGLMQTGGGLIISDIKPEPIWAKITSVTGSAYAWTEQQQDTAGTWTDHAEGLAGTTSNLPAYEINGSTTVPAGTYVQLFLAGFGGDFYFLFADPSAALYGAWKQPVRMATDAALPAYTRSGNTITANANGAAPTVDGLIVVLLDRMLLKNGAANADNGIWYWSDLGSAGTPWVIKRSADADASAKMKAGHKVNVEEGTANKSVIYEMVTANPITLNTTGLTYTTPGGAPTQIWKAYTLNGTESIAAPASGVLNVTGTADSDRIATMTGGWSGRVVDIRNAGVTLFTLQNISAGGANDFYFGSGTGTSMQWFLYPGETIRIVYSGSQWIPQNPENSASVVGRLRVLADVDCGQNRVCCITGWSATYACPTIALADAADATKMPARGISLGGLTAGKVGFIATEGPLPSRTANIGAVGVQKSSASGAPDDAVLYVQPYTGVSGLVAADQGSATTERPTPPHITQPIGFGLDNNAPCGIAFRSAQAIKQYTADDQESTIAQAVLDNYKW